MTIDRHSCFGIFVSVLALLALLGGRTSSAAGAESWWAFQPIRIAGGGPSVDGFIDERLASAQLPKAPPADRRALLRRVTFDLTGLPPTPEAMTAFLADKSDHAFAKVVELLLASPHYGERWGRWWLDVARYADSNGQDENKVLGNAWRYRDWVIRAFNTNLPFDQFITEQLAGDLLPPAADERKNFDCLVATGFLVLGPKMLAEQDKPKLVMDIVDEQIDTVGHAFLGLTLGCARCHDHKFDPVSARDYYAMAGIFKSTRTMEDLAFVSKFNERPIATKEELAAIAIHDRRMAELTNRVATAVHEANEALVSEWKRDFPQALGAALELSRGAGLRTDVDTQRSRAGSETGAPNSSAADASSNQVLRLRGFVALDPATNAVSRALRDVAAAPERAEDWLKELETRGSAPAGLRLGPGKVGAGFLATGDNHLELPHGPELDPPQLTVEAWVRVNAFPQEGDTRRWLVNKNGNEWTEGHYALVVDRRKAGAYLNIGGTKEDVFAVWSESQSLAPKQWHHLAFTYDGVDLKLFVDGKAAGDVSVERARVPGRSPLALGRRQDGYVNFKGALDEVRVHDRALTAAEVRAHFGHPDDVVREHVVARWEFNDLTDAERRQLEQAEVRDALLGAGGLFAVPTNARPLYPSRTRETLAALERERDSCQTSAPPSAAHALAVAEDRPVDVPVHLRGSHLTLASNAVPRGFIQVLAGRAVPSIPPGHSGRLELARWLTAPENPLTARVIVNRLWQAHFGEGLVRTPDNFGLRGEPPTHPALLDWLASEFIRSNWDVKAMHRLMINSAAYQRSSLTPSRSVIRTADPDNRLLSYFPRQRLEAEMIRDAVLAISGRLDPAMGGSLVNWKNNEYAPADEVSAKSVRRTVYLPIVRDRVFDALTIFDFANPGVCTARRTPTVVSHQALFFLNSPLVKDSAAALAATLLARADLDDAGRVREAYTRILNRSATRAEVRRALRFLAELPREGNSSASDEECRGAFAALCQTLFAANEFVYRP